METTAMREIGRMKLLYISDLILEVEEKLYNGIFDVDKFVHDRCAEHNITAVEKDILHIVKCYDNRLLYKLTDKSSIT